jgi:hypothetical protein
VDLNVLQTAPPRLESKVTNRTNGDAFSFSWKSAGRGGFTSSTPAGRTTGVGAKWVWSTNQPVYAFTGRRFRRAGGLLNPLAQLVPEGEPLVYPDKTFNQGQTIPAKLRILCGGVNLRSGEMEEPEIVRIVPLGGSALAMDRVAFYADSPDPFDPTSPSTRPSSSGILISGRTNWPRDLRPEDPDLG